MFSQQKTAERSSHNDDALYVAGEDGKAHGPYQGHVMKSSVYTRAMLSDAARALPFVAAGVVLAAASRRRGSQESRRY